MAVADSVSKLTHSSGKPVSGPVGKPPLCLPLKPVLDGWWIPCCLQSRVVVSAVVVVRWWRFHHPQHHRSLCPPLSVAPDWF